MDADITGAKNIGKRGQYGPVTAHQKLDNNHWSKRVFDLMFSLLVLTLFSPFLVFLAIVIWMQDFHFPLYISPRVGKDEQIFRMVKLRSMVVHADQAKVDSTSTRDPRITPVGKIVRTCKMDEIMQFWNVMKGDMSLVGPRPNVERETRLYTDEEKRLLSVRPGITDFSSIVFSDLGHILQDSADPNIDYNQLVRPWKSRLGLLYIDNQSLWLDIQLIFLTCVSFFSRKLALKGVGFILKRIGVPETLLKVAMRTTPLTPYPPPGMDQVVTSRLVAKKNTRS